VVTMVPVSHFGRIWLDLAIDGLSALVTDDVSFSIAHITTQVIPRIGSSGTIIILLRTDNMSARRW